MLTKRLWAPEEKVKDCWQRCRVNHLVPRLYTPPASPDRPTSFSEMAWRANSSNVLIKCPPTLPLTTSQRPDLRGGRSCSAALDHRWYTYSKKQPIGEKTTTTKTTKNSYPEDSRYCIGGTLSLSLSLSLVEKESITKSLSLLVSRPSKTWLSVFPC